MNLKQNNSAPIRENSLMFGPIEPECFFHSIVMKAALNTKGSTDPSGMEAELLKTIQCIWQNSPRGNRNFSQKFINQIISSCANRTILSVKNYST